MQLLELQLKLEQLEKYMTDRQLLSYALKELRAKNLDIFFEKLDALHDEQAVYINSIKRNKDAVLRYPYIPFADKIKFMETSANEINKKIENWVRKESKLSEEVSDALTVIDAAIESIREEYPQAFRDGESFFTSPKRTGLKKLQGKLLNITRILNNTETIYVLNSKQETEYLTRQLFNVPTLEKRTNEFYNKYMVCTDYASYFEKLYLNPYQIPKLGKFCDKYDKKNIYLNHELFLKFATCQVKCNTFFNTSSY